MNEAFRVRCGRVKPKPGSNVLPVVKSERTDFERHIIGSVSRAIDMIHENPREFLPGEDQIVGIAYVVWSVDGTTAAHTCFDTKAIRQPFPNPAVPSMVKDRLLGESAANAGADRAMDRMGYVKRPDPA